MPYEPPHDKTDKMACAPSEDSDQPGHPPSLIRVFPVRMKKAWALNYQLNAQWRLIRLGRCPSLSKSSLVTQSFCWFCHVAAHIKFNQVMTYTKQAEDWQVLTTDVRTTGHGELGRLLFTKLDVAKEQPIFFQLHLCLNEQEYDKTSKMTCLPRDDSDQPGHLFSLIRVVSVHFMGS